MDTIHEYVGNLHMHTPYSDGEASHAEIAAAAIRVNLDFVVVTDHNLWVDGVQGYYGGQANRRVLLLTGEEVHDRRREPQANHLLVYGVEHELVSYASRPQTLINQIIEADEGVCYLAHPVDPPADLFHEPGLPWEDWDVQGYTGLELWNYMSEFKTYLTSKLSAVRAALNPDRYISGPFPETLALWDRLLAEGRRVRVIGGADAHGTRYSMGPISRVIFPYDFLFRCVNTHILTPRAFSGDYEHDRALILQSLRDGHAFVGYDWPAPTRGFRFSAQGHNFSTIMGGWIRIGHGVTLQMVSPRVADMRLIKDGQIVARETEGTHRTYIASDPGVYRVEIYIQYKGQSRGWIFSNPIFVVK
jgi:hypothetical protein